MSDAATSSLGATIRRGIGNIGTYVTATGEPVTREGKERKAALEALDELVEAIREIREKAEKLPFANEPYEVAADIERLAREALA